MIRRKTTKNPTRIGTSYFKNISDALRYYRDYDLDNEDVMEKIRKGEIHIGKPPVRAEEHIILDPLENRYFYQTRNPRKKVARTKVGRNPTMTKSEVIEYFKEHVLPHVTRRYESDNIIDAPARREAWNDMIDVLIKDGLISKSAEDWALPSQFGRESEIKKNPRRKLTKSKSRRNPECCTELDSTSLKESVRRLLGNEYTPDRERNLLSVYRKYKTIIERGTFNEDKVYEIISAFDRVLLNLGVEHVRPGRLEYHEEKVITYSNTGGTYDPTILHVDGKFWIGSWGDVVENESEFYSERNPRKSKKSRNPRNIQLKPAKRYSIDIPSRLSIILKRDHKSELGGEAIFIDGIFKGYIEKIDSDFVLTPASDYEGKDHTYYQGNKIGFVQGPSFYSYSKTALLKRVQK